MYYQKVKIMSTPILTFVFDRKKRGNSKKEASVELRITYNRRQKYITTGVRLYPKQWRNGRITDRPDALEMQRTLDTIMTRARTVVNNMLESGSLSLDEIPSQMAKLIEDRRSFIDYCCERAQVRKYGKAPDTQERYDRFLRWFRKWGRIVYFSDVTDRNIMLLDETLSKKKMKANSIWFNYHRILNSFILDAQSDGLLSRNPYKHLRIEKDKSSGGLGKYLTLDEFRRIERLQPNIPYLERVRDLFVFQTYTCLSYTDLAAFDASKAINIGGRKVYTAKRGKTKQEFTFLLLRPAEIILEKYGGKLPIISNTKYNAYLKALALAAGIAKPLSSHWARHTGATILLNEGMNMEIVAKVLGHSSTRITRQVYAKLLDETVMEAMAKYETSII